MAQDELLTPKEKATLQLLMQGFAEAAKANSMTPDAIKSIIAEAKKPYVDEEALARDKRERVQFSRDYHEGKKVTDERRRNCPHRHPNGQNALGVQHNMPDGLGRGLCPICADVLHPQRYEYMAPNRDGSENKIILPEHPKYYMVREKEAMS